MTLVLLPFLLLVMALAIDGLAMAASYNRAVGLARTAAQAGTTRLDFDGSGVNLRGDACQTAVELACFNAGGCGDATVVRCSQTGAQVEVTVALRPLRVFGDGLGFAPNRVLARARSAPGVGIETEE
jgi:hypothetical protein